MHPVLFHIGDWPVGTYGLFYLGAFLSAIAVGGYLAHHHGIGYTRYIDLAFLTAISGEIGARLTFLIVEWDRVVSGGLSLKQFFFSGRVVLGGVAIGVSALMIAVWRLRLPVFLLADVALTGTALGMAVGRLGCLFAGCCYGRPTDWWWGITFTDPLARQFNGTPLGIALHPTQLLQAIEGFVLFGILFWLFWRRRFDGQNAALYWLLAGASRFLTEFLRGDDRGQLHGLFTSQWIGLAAIAVGALWLIYGFRHGRLTPPA